MSLAFTKITSNNEVDNQSMIVVLWDLGPSKPVPPERPTPPKGEIGDPLHDLAVIEFKQELEDYEAALKTFRQAKTEFADFQKRYGGPIEIERYSCDAQDALDRDSKRYVISSRTRGHEKLKNRGLPIGVKPGHGQDENMRRRAEGEADLEQLRRADPVFGTQEARQ